MKHDSLRESRPVLDQISALNPGEIRDFGIRFRYLATDVTSGTALESKGCEPYIPKITG